jgi:L,D-peptidoglycan transpeptidase YkuD (ErfK/YbiS/YcfS/YnhG family)
MSRRSLITAGTAAGALTAVPALGAERPVIEVTGAPGSISGTLKFASQTYPCMLGRSGILAPKFEGDGGTPGGLFPLREIRYRPDKMAAPKSGLPVYLATPTDGWCDDPADLAYNHLVHMYHQTDAEVMWRDDEAYDVLAVIGYNDNPTVPGAGSAIFLHVRRPDGKGGFKATAGCVAIDKDALLAVLAACTPGTMIRIKAG